MKRSSEIPSTWSVVRAVGKVTVLEILRDKVLYNALLVAALLLAVSLLSSQLSIIRPDRVVLNFGISALNIASTLLAILLGSSMVNREFERRTIFVALSHPVSRAQFILGKYAGLCLILLLNWLLLSGSLMAVLAGVSQTPELILGSGTFHAGLVLVLLQSFVIGAIAVMFSASSSTAVSALFSLGLYLAGNNISQLRLLAARMKSVATRELLELIASMLPSMEQFNLGLKLTYDLPVSGAYVGYSAAYAISVVAIALIIAAFLIRTKEA